MAPNLTGSATGLFLAEAEVVPAKQDTQTVRPPVQPSGRKPEQQFRNLQRLVWRNVFAFIYLNVGSLYGLYLAFTVAYAYTNLWVFLLGAMNGLGITAGAHRLWAHRSYKAKWPLRVFLAMCQTLAFQNHIYEWVRDHRVHHKFTDTDADPHNSRRGFFFSHMGWLCVRKHPDVLNKGKIVDMSDLEKDWVVVFQRKYYAVLLLLFWFAFPTFVPMWLWGESFWTSFYVATILRYNLALHITWLVNSAAHMWGMRPYDRHISAAENLAVACAAIGEGWHNYHHAFPWDYKTSEFHKYRTNLTCGFIDLCAKMGLAYDLKTVPPELISRKIARSGDGSREKHDHSGEVWGWGDKDISEEEVKIIKDYLETTKKTS